MTTTSPIQPEVSPADEFRYRQALEAARPDMAALTEDKIHSVSLDIPHCVMTVRGAIADILPFKAPVAAAISSFDTGLFDKLETYAMALGYANTRYRAATSPMEPIEALHNEALRLREVLLTDLRPMAARGLVESARLDEVKRQNGFNNVAQEVMLMTELARNSWAKIASRTLLTLDEIAQAERVAERLVKAAGEKAQIKPSATAEFEEWRRAYTLLVNAYDQVRRAISFLRWAQDDIDSIAPSLWAENQKGRRRTDKPAEPAVNAQPAAPSGTTPTSPVTPTTQSQPTSSGLPGEDPLVR